MASVTNYKGDVSDLMDQKHSGLINYLFGKDRKKEINKEKFMKLQQDLMDDVLWLEFARYTKDGETISEVDFCKHLLLCANITSKKKKQMVSPESLSLYYFTNIILNYEKMVLKVIIMRFLHFRLIVLRNGQAKEELPFKILKGSTTFCLVVQI